MHEISGDGGYRRGAGGNAGGGSGGAAADARPPPVQETQAPENQAINPEQKTTGPLPPAAARRPGDRARQAGQMGRQRAAGHDRSADPDQRRQRHLDERRRLAATGGRSPSTCSATSTPCRSRGGTPTRIAEGLAYEQQPRFSPDGRRIAFTSDRGGGDNIWIMNVDGSRQAPADQGGFPAAQPAELEPGRPLHRRQEAFHHRPLARHRRGLALPRLRRRRRAAGQEAPTSSMQKELGEPIYAPDGKSDLLTPATSRPGPIFEYAQDSNTDLFDIERYDLDTGEVTTAVSGAGGSVRPTPSPDGKKIAFVRRERDRVQALRQGPRLGRGAQDLRRARPGRAGDLGGDRRLSEHGLDARQPERRVLGRRQDPPGRRATAAAPAEIPFRVNDTRVVIDATHPQVEVAPDRFTTKMPRWASVSPDGRQVVFETLGKLWVKPMAGGAARRLVERRRGRASSSSRPGRATAGRSSSSAGPTRASAASAPSRAAGGAARDVTTQPGHYARPRFSPDGRTIVFEQGAGRVPDLAALVARIPASTASPPPAARRCGSPATAPSRSSAPSNDRVVHDRVGRQGQAPAGQHRPERRGQARPCDRRDGQRLSASRPTASIVAFRQNYQAFVMPLHARHPGRRRRRQGRAAAGDQGQRRRRRLHPLVERRPAAPLEPRPDRLHRRHRRACSRAAPPAENAPKFKPPTDRRVAVDGRRRRQADRRRSR